MQNINITASAIVLSEKVDSSNVVVIEIFTILQKKFQAVFPYYINGEAVFFEADANKKYHTSD